MFPNRFSRVFFGASGQGSDLFSALAARFVLSRLYVATCQEKGLRKPTAFTYPSNSSSHNPCSRSLSRVECFLLTRRFPPLSMFFAGKFSPKPLLRRKSIKAEL